MQPSGVAHSVSIVKCVYTARNLYFLQLAIQPDLTLCFKIQRIKASVRPRKLETLRRGMDATRFKIHSTIFNTVNAVESTTHTFIFVVTADTTKPQIE